MQESSAIPSERKHSYHAEAHAIAGELTLPLKNKIPPQAFVKLGEEGGYLSERSSGFRLESIVQYASAYTQVSGHREVKPGHGFNTLVTSVVEGLNILEVVTCDRVVSQIATEHPLVGYTPHISFLGTRFDNLRICGHPVKIDIDLDMCGERLEDDSPYTKSPWFIDRVVKQHARIREQKSELSVFEKLLGRYNRVSESFEDSSSDEEVAECSLVNQVEGAFPGRRFGHVIHVPHFGTVYLATLKITHYKRNLKTNTVPRTLVDLTMIDIQMGCATTGGTTAGRVGGGGTSHP